MKDQWGWQDCSGFRLSLSTAAGAQCRRGGSWGLAWGGNGFWRDLPQALHPRAAFFPVSWCSRGRGWGGVGAWTCSAGWPVPAERL